MKLNSVNDIREFFIGELKDEAYTIDKTGQKTIELIGAQFVADEPSIFGTPNLDYIKEEIRWYENQSTNVNDIGEKVPQAWQYTANKHGEINSNYGHLIWSDKYFNQYGMVLDELLRNPDGRRATMVYNRPSIWIEFDENGKNDFICTNAVTYYIRDGLLHAVVQMRSNDVIYGYKNDYAWQQYVLEKMAFDYTNLDRYDNGNVIEAGQIIWQVQNLHVYERHFHLVK
jgi:thymidylate synthase